MQRWNTALRRVGLLIGGGALLAALGAAVLLFQFWLFLRAPAHPGLGYREMTVPSGVGALGVAEALRDAGIITDARRFSLLCRLRHCGSRLQAGDYGFSESLTPEQVLDQIVSGKVLIQQVTLPEGITIRDAAEILERRGLASREEILHLARDPAFIDSLGLEGDSLEGYLFPETYRFKKKTTAEALLKAMTIQFRRRLPKDYAERLEALGMSLKDVVILASMIEKEAVVDAERPRIAAVFYNRLHQHMPLQSDPTAVYDLPDFTGPITVEQLKRQSPYNTYVVPGLPVGPICSPGAKSIQAALHPESVPYLYFVSNNDGTHSFSETLAEHRQAVHRTYLKRKALQESSSEAAPADTSKEDSP